MTTILIYREPGILYNVYWLEEDSVIIDPLDTGIMSLMYAPEALVDKDPKCMKYLKAVRAGIVKA